MGLKEAFRKVGQAIEETKMKIGMKKYKKGGIQIEESKRSIGGTLVDLPIFLDN